VLILTALCAYGAWTDVHHLRCKTEKVESLCRIYIMKTNFQQVFFTVVAFTLFSGVGSIILSQKTNPSPQQSRLSELYNTTWNLGVGGIFGLLGAADPPKSKSEESDEEDETGDQKADA
jgi:hypothetical protein